MHELSLCRTLVDLIAKQCALQPERVVKKVTLEVGELVFIDRSALQLAFEVLTQGSQMQGAVLEIIMVAGQARCNACAQLVTIHQYYDCCSHCGQFSLTVMQGEELHLKCLEME